MSDFSIDKMIAAYMDVDDEYILMRGSKEDHWVMYRRVEKEDMPTFNYSQKDLNKDIKLVWPSGRELELSRKDQ